MLLRPWVVAIGFAFSVFFLSLGLTPSLLDTLFGQNLHEVRIGRGLGALEEGGV